MDYRGLTLLAPPPPTQGLTTLAIMAFSRHFDFSALPLESAERMHLLVEAVKQAFLDRPRIGDSQILPLWTPLSSSIRNVWPQRPRPSIPGRHSSGRSPSGMARLFFFGVVDQQGRAASVFAKYLLRLGKAACRGDTGILWHNRAASFSVEAGHPNQIRPASGLSSHSIPALR